MKNLKSLLAIFCVAILSFAFCGEAFAGSTTVRTGSKSNSKHSNSAHASSGGVSLSTGNKTKHERASALPDGLNDSSKYKVLKYEVMDGNTVQIILENGKTYRAILYGVEVPKTWESWQVEMAKKKLNEMLGKATTITAQVWSNKAKDKARLSRSSSRSVSTLGTATSGSTSSRTLIVKMFAKNFDLGKLMIGEGYAICYDAEIDPKGMGATDYARVQVQAQREAKGCWGPNPDEKPEPEPEPEPSEENPDEDYFKF